VAWPREVGGVGMAVPTAAASGGNWSRRAHAREEGRRGRQGGVLYLAYDRAISENGGAYMSSARSSMADIRPCAAHAPRARGREQEGVEGVGAEKGEAQAGCSGAPPRRGRHGHMAERRTCGVERS
jgi:hypothetical protein